MSAITTFAETLSSAKTAKSKSATSFSMLSRFRQQRSAGKTFRMMVGRGTIMGGIASMLIFSAGGATL